MTRSTFLSSPSVALQTHTAAISLTISRVVSVFGVLLFVTSIYFSSFDIPSYNINNRSTTSDKLGDSPAIMEGSNGATITQQAYEVDLASFLETRKKDFMHGLRSSGRLDGWVIVMGNEAGDLDSIASAIGYSYFSSHMPSSSATTASTKYRYLPLYQAEVADLILRPENSEAFSRSGINPAEHILFLDDLKGYEKELYSRGVRYALVDANNLTPRFGEPTKDDQDAVIGILDHHEDLGLYSKAEPRWIQVPTGSCASLVTEYFYPRLQPADFKSVPKTLVDLLISSIIIDTDNGKPAPKGKAVQTDQDALRHLLPLSSYASSTAGGDISTASSSSSLITYHELLVHEKYDLTPLKGRDLLRRDYKEYISEHAHIRYGLSSVPMALQVWLDREEIGGSWDKILQELENWGAEKNLDFVGVLTSYFSPKKNGVGTKKGREQLYLVRSRTNQPVSEDKLKQIFEYLQQDETLDLDTLKSGQPTFTEQRWKSNTYAFEQKQASATRKQVAPALKKAVEAVEQ